MSITASGGPWPSRPWALCTAAPLRAFLPPRETARERVFERFATAGKTRIGHEVFLGVERLLAPGRFDTAGRAVGQEGPALLVVHEVGGHDLLEHLLVHRGIEDRAQRLDAAVEVARHHVGR